MIIDGRSTDQPRGCISMFFLKHQSQESHKPVNCEPMILHDPLESLDLEIQKQLR